MIATRAPAAASPAAIAEPMPWVDPVTSAVFPLRSTRICKPFLASASSPAPIQAQLPGAHRLENRLPQRARRRHPRRMTFTNTSPSRLATYSMSVVLPYPGG
ncbi:hypothetical protein AB0M71_49790, partial [Amycolatopsis sp. NPDC051114]|uniref:hypothetical protein n=1 Tax=Amycolatopsis sp. NPDC051114 TaxID=3155280 RepID=UPI0034151CED